jgi:hypothetical protein
MTQEEVTAWLFAVDAALSEIVDQQSGTLEDENFLMLWWQDIREGWAWRSSNDPTQDSRNRAPDYSDTGNENARQR